MDDARVYSDSDSLFQLRLIEKRGMTRLDWRRMVFGEDLARYEKAVADALRSPKPQEIRYRLQRSDGKLIPVVDYFGRIESEGSWPVLAGCIRDESANIRIQQVERHALVGSLVSGMIHDFKNLLAGMQNIIEWCLSQLPPEDNAYQALTKTIAYTDQANRLITSTLRLISGKESHTIEKINVAEIVGDLEELIRHIISETITIEINVEGDLLPVSSFHH